MKNNELRFNNLVKVPDGIGYFTCRVTAIDEIGCRVNLKCEDVFKFYDEIEPIELTEEWLLRFGFKLIERKGMYGNIYAIHDVDSRLCIERDFNKHLSYFVGIEYTDSPFEKDENVTYNFSYDLKYVHQLQNLYFALTGVELQLSST